MLLEELEEFLDDALPAGWSLEVNRKGEVIIRTNCRKDDDGELISLDEDFDEDELPFSDEETVPLEDEEDDVDD